MSPAMSSVPSVFNAWCLADDKTSLMPANCWADADLSSMMANSPSVAFSMACTSSAVFGITSIFKSLKSWIWPAVCDRARSRSWISVRRDEHTHLRYWSFAVAQNWSMHVKYALRHVL